MLKAVFLLISKLDGPPSPFVPLSAAENRQAPSKRYVLGQLLCENQVTFSGRFHQQQPFK